MATIGLLNPAHHDSDREEIPDRVASAGLSRKDPLVSIILIILAAVGLTISSYFTAVAYGWIDPTEKWIPSFCRMGEQTCSRVIFSPRARVFGLPNSLLGQLFYLAILAATLANLLFLKPFFLLFLSASFLTVLLGIYLSYSLLYLTRIRCVLCFTSHAINGIIFLILLLAGA